MTNGSNLSKVFKLIKNDDEFLERVTAACWQANIEYTEDVLKHVARDPGVLANASLLESTGISSSGVTDQQIVDSVDGYTSN